MKLQRLAATGAVRRRFVSTLLVRSWPIDSLATAVVPSNFTAAAAAAAARRIGLRRHRTRDEGIEAVRVVWRNLWWLNDELATTTVPSSAAQLCMALCNRWYQVPHTKRRHGIMASSSVIELTPQLALCIRYMPIPKIQCRREYLQDSFWNYFLKDTSASTCLFTSIRLFILHTGIKISCLYLLTAICLFMTDQGLFTQWLYYLQLLEIGSFLSVT